MNKYTELSDFEVNKKVAEKLGLAYEVTRYGVVTRMSNKEQWREFNPCNNPTDAMPIINEYGISLIYQDRKFQFATNDGNIECSVSNPLKAAMIIFMCIKDAENEND
ncbi:recombinase [Proteus mirabilis]|uniref:phage protein NinX family protein n=1 Tax=Proteus mirabilis TaxID=584 RepID=UPI0008DDEE0E|nr:phage protein NinX family protein [Proteus mirabilis]OHY45591.1 recombinase [Proteus mirabilis]